MLKLARGRGVMIAYTLAAALVLPKEAWTDHVIGGLIAQEPATKAQREGPGRAGALLLVAESEAEKSGSGKQGGDKGGDKRPDCNRKASDKCK